MCRACVSSVRIESGQCSLVESRRLPGREPLSASSCNTSFSFTVTRDSPSSVVSRNCNAAEKKQNFTATNPPNLMHIHEVASFLVAPEGILIFCTIFLNSYCKSGAAVTPYSGVTRATVCYDPTFETHWCPPKSACPCLVY